MNCPHCTEEDVDCDDEDLLCPGHAEEMAAVKKGEQLAELTAHSLETERSFLAFLISMYEAVDTAECAVHVEGMATARHACMTARTAKRDASEASWKALKTAYVLFLNRLHLAGVPKTVARADSPAVL